MQEQLYYTDENLGDACDQAFWKLLQLSPITQSLKHKSQSLKHKSQLGEGAKKKQKKKLTNVSFGLTYIHTP